MRCLFRAIYFTEMVEVSAVTAYNLSKTTGPLFDYSLRGVFSSNGPRTTAARTTLNASWLTKFLQKLLDDD